LNGELPHEGIDVIGAVSQSVYDFEGLDISSRIELGSGWDYWIIYHTSVFIHLERYIALRLREIEEGGGEIDLCDAEAADIVIDSRKHETAISGLCKNAFISVQTLEHDHGGNIGTVHLDGLAGCHGARIGAIDVFADTIYGIGVVLFGVGEVWTCGLGGGRALEGEGEGGKIWTCDSRADILAGIVRPGALRRGVFTLRIRYF
jgi:hypothetical protein